MYTFSDIKQRFSEKRYWLVLPLMFILQISIASEQKTPNQFTRQILQETAENSSGFVDEFDAAVWMVAMNSTLKRYVKDQQIRADILRFAHREASRHDIDPQIILSVMHVESLFDQFAISRVGAQGIMQIMPFWKKELNEPDANLFNLETNIRFGCLILKTYLKIEKGNMARALGRYNGSLGKRKYPDKVFLRLKKYWSFSD
jgi:soluble lytic murein transglycosylase-like protein